VDAEFLVDALEMGMHRPRADPEGTGDFLIGNAAAETTEDFLLADSQKRPGCGVSRTGMGEEEPLEVGIDAGVPLSG